MPPSLSAAFLVACLAATACGLGACASNPSGVPQREDLVGTSWLCLAVEGREPLAGTELSLRLDGGGRAGGSAGVNRWFSAWTWSEDGRIAFSAIGTTRMAGPPAAMEQEQRFLDALQEVERASLEGGRLRLSGAGGALLEFGSP